MTRRLEITLEVRKNDYDVDVYEPETGDFVSFTFEHDDEIVEIDNVLGSEIRSWVYMMMDHLEDEASERVE